MADEAQEERLQDDVLDALVERLAENPALLRALAERIVRRKAIMGELREALSDVRASLSPEPAGAGEPPPARAPGQSGAQVEAAPEPAGGAEKRTGPGSTSPQEVLDRSVISTALADQLARDRAAGRAQPFPVIIDLNLSHAGMVQDTNDQLTALIESHLPGVQVNRKKARRMPQYVFARMTESELLQLVKLDLGQVPQGKAPPGSVEGTRAGRLIHRIWPDFRIRAGLHRTGATIKAEAARVAFAAAGQDIVWAVMDSGIQGDHPHFARWRTLEVAPLEHVSLLDGDDQPLTDECGHGTHVAGVIAGEWVPDLPPPPAGQGEPHQRPFVARVAYREGQEDEDLKYRALSLERLSGIAPRTKLVSYKVLDAGGDGEVSNLMAAIADVQERNGYGKLLQIHGVNISIGYPFDPEWFACGQSPVCIEVDRLVRSGVVVVVAAGNSGYGTIASKLLGPVSTSLALTINDPGNAELAITVGAAHREYPHTYGVSYFSSKGPTGDGRLKPDLVAPGERILSCAAGHKRQTMRDKGADADYAEDSGTSMATPHVSGAIAAFLSVQREYIGRPDAVKRILMDTATDLGRHRDFQGRGMVDVMRAIQSV